MQRKVTNLLIALAVLSLMATVTHAQAPTTMTYQGRLTNAAGTPITTATDVTFTIYDDPTTGSALWTETISGLTPDANGLFTVVLGATTPLTPGVFSGVSRYLGIQVAADAEMTPRQALNSAPYSMSTGLLPGLASGSRASGSISDVDYAQIASANATFPAPGYVAVFCEAAFFSTVANIWLDGRLRQDGAATEFWYWDAGDTDSWYDLKQVHIYTGAVTAGAHTYDLSVKISGNVGTGSATHAKIIVMYFPTNVGTVVSAVAPNGNITPDVQPALLKLEDAGQ